MTSKFIKYTFTASIAIAALSSCHRDKFYSCYCSNQDTTIYTNLGRMSSENAYAQCRAFEDSTLTCSMEIRR